MAKNRQYMYVREKATIFYKTGILKYNSIFYFHINCTTFSHCKRRTYVNLYNIHDSGTRIPTLLILFYSYAFFIAQNVLHKQAYISYKTGIPKFDILFENKLHNIFTFLNIASVEKVLIYIIPMFRDPEIEQSISESSLHKLLICCCCKRLICSSRHCLLVHSFVSSCDYRCARMVYFICHKLKFVTQSS